jgi:DNA-directed RNA polymerase specialized sigma24 family protein
MSDHATNTATESFVAYRNLLFTVAYEMLGSAADAEDVLQETWMRWVKVDLGQVHDQRAYLVRITTRESLNRLRTRRQRKEAYIGPWQPEPLLTAPQVAENVELAESVSIALMLEQRVGLSAVVGGCRLVPKSGSDLRKHLQRLVGRCWPS